MLISQGPLDFVNLGAHIPRSVHPLQGHPALILIYQNLQRMIEDYLRSISVLDIIKMVSSYDHVETVLNRLPITKEPLDKFVAYLSSLDRQPTIPPTPIEASALNDE